MRPTPRTPGLRRLAVLTALGAGLASAALGLNLAGLPVPATINDFFQPGTQPQTLTAGLATAQSCASCHGFYDPAVEPYERWKGSLMAQATRDPVFHACLAVANQDVEFAGDLCLRCHTPMGWMDGRSTPTDGSALDKDLGDFDGVNCHFCHRMLDVVYDPANPVEDGPILQTLALNGELPTDSPHSGQYVLDPDDRRRGPFDLGGMFFWHEWLESPYHRKASMCGTCHDVSNPAYTRQPDGTYALNAYDAPHPTHSKYDEFPVERTFSEWAKSDFALAEIEMGGRFGGNKTAVATCQDCHMPDASGTACAPGFGGAFRDDLPLHDFNGGNTWVLKAVRGVYPDSETGLDPLIVDASIQRAKDMLSSAADLYAWERAGELVVRVVNQSGHKLPTGYPEGRRMWLNVKFYDASNALVAERGHYDFVTADLTTGDTTVFEAKLGMDAATAAVAGLPPGESFHFVLNNEVLKDNRIPPRGFTNRGFEAVQSEPVDATFDDQQYWSDSSFPLPLTATRAVVTLYYQTTSKEYIEFLRDENSTNAAGQVAYDQWELHGKSAPHPMVSADVQLAATPCPEPIPYGLPTETSAATLPSVEWQGAPGHGAANFSLRLRESVPHSIGALFWSDAPSSDPFTPGWGSWYLAAPRTRLATVTTNGQGTTNWVPIPITPAMIGTERCFQFLVRDPAAPGGANLSPAVHVDFCP